MIKKLVFLFAVAASAVMAQAGQVVYNLAPEASSTFGTAKTETYDVAVRLTNAGFIGKKISAVEIPVKESSYVSDYSVFLTKTLKLKSRKNDPDIVNVSVEPVDGKLVVKFDEPYTITDEGVYIGYSFSAKKDEEKPLIGAYTSSAEFYIHTSRTYYSWMNKTSYGFVPTMSVTLDGDFYENAASISFKGDALGLIGKESPIATLISNFGSSPIASVDVAYEYASEAGTVHVDLDEAIPAEFAKSQVVEVALPASQVKGEQDLTLTVTKVNGSENKNEYKSVTGLLRFCSFVPKHRPVMEEYTGTWCGWCPRGFAAMQYMNERYPDFIGVAFHSGDPMQNVTGTPNEVSGYPMCWYDRELSCDPYYGTSGYKYFAIESDWLARSETSVLADIDVQAVFESAESDIINVNTTVKFCTDLSDANYKVGYELVENGMHSPSAEYDDDWEQSNYFYTYGYDPNDYISELATFCVNEYVDDLQFDDVAIYAPDMLGIENSIPTTIKDAEPIDLTYTFDTSKAVSAYYNDGTSLVQDRNNLYVVALLLDGETGKIVNANRVHVSGADGVANAVINDAHAVSTEYFDLSGRKLDNPKAGLYIKRVQMSDGKVKSEKVIVK
jgi:hypothetical protein